MDAPKFYIFGVPDGFDMLDGSRQEISYYQRFYDGSTEDTKFTMHRDSNGNVTYSFLKYNLSSGKSRTGSFFGMSLAYSGYYCIHPLKLYELFDYVYQNHVLCNTPDVSTGILRPIANSDIKAQYLITRFEDQKEHIKFIEKVLLHNLGTNGVLASSFYLLDPGFKNENLNLVVKTPLVEGLKDETQIKLYEENLINRFRGYGYVTISPDWKSAVKPGPEPEEPIIEIAPQTIVHWKESIPNYQRYIIQGLGNLTTTNTEEVKKYEKQIEEEVLNPLKKHSYNKNIAPSLKTDYEELRNQLADLYQKAKDAQVNTPSPQPPTPPSFGKNITVWISENKIKVAGIVGAIAALVVVLALFHPKKEVIPPEKPSYCQLAADSIKNKLNAGLYNEAKTIAERIPDSEQCRDENLKMVNESQVKFLDEEIDNLKSQNKWKEAFEIAKGYFGDDTQKTKTAGLKDECENYFRGEISNITDNNYSTESKRLKKELEAVKDYIGDQYSSLELEIKGKAPKANPPVNTPNYVVEFYKTDVSYIPDSNNPTLTFNTSGTINVGDDHYIYKIKKDGKYLSGANLKNAVNSNNNGEIYVPKNDNIRLFLQQSQGGTLKIGEEEIIITIEK